MVGKVVLITGCSTGIGQDLAQRLTQAGYIVVATARRVETLTDLPAALKLPLDVTDPASVASAVAEVVRQLGRIDVLVNNAGYGVRGAVEEVSDEQVQAMFDVNVFGIMRMVRAVAPVMRKQGGGRIINVGSIAGKLVVPVNGTYSSTKFAVEALSDALRLEMAPFGIRVVLIEPGNIRTSFMATAQAHAEAVFANPDSPYRELYQRYQTTMKGMRAHEPGPEVVSRVVQQAMETGNPKARYVVAVPFANRLIILLGDGIRDFLLKQMFKSKT